MRGMPLPALRAPSRPAPCWRGDADRREGPAILLAPGGRSCRVAWGLEIVLGVGRDCRPGGMMDRPAPTASPGGVYPPPGMRQAARLGTPKCGSAARTATETVRLVLSRNRPWLTDTFYTKTTVMYGRAASGIIGKRVKATYQVICGAGTGCRRDC